MDKKIRIRVVREEDNLHLATIIRGVFDEHDAPKNGTVYSDPTTLQLYELFRKVRSVLWVAESEEQILGCCGIYPTEGLPEDTVELVKFYLPLTSRGKGIGKSLMDQSIQSAVDLGFKNIYLESLPHFSKAISIYEKQGFKMINHPLGNSGHTSCNIWMTKKL